MVQTAITLDTTVSACKEQVSREVDGEIVVLSVKSGVYFGLNPVGAVIWGWIQEPATVAAVREKLVRQFEDVEPEAATGLLLGFLQELADAGLVEVTAPNYA
jgi:hypothetical protein